MSERFMAVVFLSAISLPLLCAAQNSATDQYSVDQQLVIASFELDVDRVKSLLASGADPDARMGAHDRSLFKDKWTLGTPIASSKWTPLLAVANSHRAPQPEKRTENTTMQRRAALKRRNAIDPEVIEERDERRVAIAKMLIAADADLDLDDGVGATALSRAVYLGYEQLSLLLIESGAEINTKTGIYIDGTADITPVHRATKSPDVLKAMIEHGANVNVEDAAGRTPLDWAVSFRRRKSVELLIDAGAAVDARHAERILRPRFLDRSTEAERKRIFELLKDTAGK